MTDVFRGMIIGAARARGRSAPRDAAFIAGNREANLHQITSELFGDETNPLVALQLTTALRRILDEWEAVLVQRCRDEAGSSWHDIGFALGVSAQAAHQRFAR